VPLGSLDDWYDFEPDDGFVDMEDWRYEFHGQHCRFVSKVAGQILEVDISCGLEFGVLDPYFFVEYIRSTEAHSHLAPFLRDYQSSLRTLEIMERRGTLRRIFGEVGRAHSGLVAY